MTTINRSPEFRLIDFKITSAVNVGGGRAVKEFVVQAFGINEKGESASINVKGFQSCSDTIYILGFAFGGSSHDVDYVQGVHI